MRRIMLTLLLVFSGVFTAAANDERPGVKLPFGVVLNGKFDVAYERYGYTDKLGDGEDALRNYHHFVFLSRNSKTDPFFFTAEVVDLYFYEFGARWAKRESPWSLSGRAGKLVVPFGPEPVFHHTYGGLSGFDQRMLPIVWSQHGAAANVRFAGDTWSLSNDMYLVQGYELGQEEAILNLQSDFSPNDTVKAGFGDRLAFGWGPLSAWYSAYFNPLGFDRLLFMQALDASIWRPTRIPVIRDLALTLGAMRADVSGGGEDLDYYHFADYVQVRYYPVDWLYVQYRTGLMTFGNRQDLYIDEDRLTNKDAGAHNVSIVYRNGGFLTELSHYWNVEEVNELDNDFLRFRMGYEF